MSAAAHAVNANEEMGAAWQAVNASDEPGTNTTPETNAELTVGVMDELQTLSADDADAAELTAAAYTMAVEQVREAYPDLPAAERMDAAVAIATYALNGPGQIGHLSAVDNGSTSVVEIMEGIRDTGLVQWGAANENLDTTNGGGTLHPGFDDDTDNQAFHTNFFIAAGYVAGGDVGPTLLANAGNLAHETIDPNAWGQGGGSMADFGASVQGIVIGREMAEARQVAAQADAGEIAHGHDLDLLLPSMAYGGMSQDGFDPPRVEGMSDAQYQGSIEMADSMRESRDSFIGQLAGEKNIFAWPFITFFQIPAAINDLLGRN